MSWSFNFVVDAIKSELGASNNFALRTTVYSLSSTVTLIGSNSSTIALIVYVLVEPFSAVTTILIVLDPSSTDLVPNPSTLAEESAFVPVTFIVSVLAGKLTV